MGKDTAILPFFLPLFLVLCTFFLHEFRFSVFGELEK